MASAFFMPERIELPNVEQQRIQKAGSTSGDRHAAC